MECIKLKKYKQREIFRDMTTAKQEQQQQNRFIIVDVQGIFIANKFHAKKSAFQYLSHFNVGKTLRTN